MIRKTVAQFMQEALYSAENGYYISQNPIGKNNDFITAPEISQLFGEMIGVFCANEWFKLGSPSEFNLVELGPGKGTMMQDLLRATKHIPGFSESLKIHFVETNKIHIELQKNLFEATWHKDISSLPFNKPFIIIANEFFDCLPINQYIFTKNGWCERYVQLTNEKLQSSSSRSASAPRQSIDCLTSFAMTEDLKKRNENQNFINLPVDDQTNKLLSRDYPNATIDSIVEINYSARNIVKLLCKKLKKTSGCILIIDYGYDLDSPFGSTLQAIKNHKFHSVFENIGDADLTAHVDFRALRKIALAENLQVSATISQREFLLKHGIDIRAKMLMQNASPQQKQEIQSGLSRLIDNNQMGQLFRSINISKHQI